MASHHGALSLLIKGHSRTSQKLTPPHLYFDTLQWKRSLCKRFATKIEKKITLSQQTSTCHTIVKSSESEKASLRLSSPKITQGLASRCFLRSWWILDSGLSCLGTGTKDKKWFYWHGGDCLGYNEGWGEGLSFLLSKTRGMENNGKVNLSVVHTAFYLCSVLEGVVRPE